MIYYRMSDRLSKNRPPIFKDDKLRVVKLCLKTFVKAFKDVKPEIFFILDRCTGDYLDMIREVYPMEFKYEFTDYGHYNSALRQYNLAQETKDDIILFVEDDYLWTEGSGKLLTSVIKELGVVSPYDHPDFYTTEPRKSRQEKIRLINNWHWRTIQDTTMTFGITRKLFMKHRKTFDNWGPSDTPLWAEAKETIWCPVPALATHFVEGKLSPGVDWTEYWR